MASNKTLNRPLVKIGERMARGEPLAGVIVVWRNFCPGWKDDGRILVRLWGELFLGDLLSAGTNHGGTFVCIPYYYTVRYNVGNTVC